MQRNRILKIIKDKFLLVGSIFLFAILLSSCAYPLASLFNAGVMPSALGTPWRPNTYRVNQIRKIGVVEPVDPDLLNGPLSLGQIVDFSLRNNPNTSLSWANILGAIADLGLARQDYFPTVNVSGNLDRTRTMARPPNNFFQQEAEWLTFGGVTGTVSYTLWDFGARFAKSESALQMLFAMSYAYNQELQTVIQSVTNDFYSYLYNKAALQDRVRDVSDANLLLEAAEKKLKLGIANVTDLVQAKTTYLSAQVDLVSQRDFTENALAKLATDMGLASNTIFATQDFPCTLPGEEFLASTDTFIEIALQNRPDLIRYKAEVLSKKAALAQSRLDPLPKVTGELDMDYQAYHGYRYTYDFKGMLKIAMPLFDGFFYRNKTREAKSELQQALANLRIQQDQILKEVTSYYNNYKNAVEKIDYTQNFLDAAYEEFQVTLGNYKAGTGDILNVMQALTSLSDARTKFTLSVEDLFVSLTNLAYATGSLVSPMDDSWQGIYQFNEEP